MNKFVDAIKSLDLEAIKNIVRTDPKWLSWDERDGKNAIHFLCGVSMVEMKPNGKPVAEHKDAETKSLQILKFFIKSGMDMNSIHRIPDKNCGYFPATPVWWAYTRGRNETLYKYLLRQGADPRHCMYAITWYDDTKAADLFKKYGSFGTEPGSSAYFEHIDNPNGMDSPLFAAFSWKKWKMAEWLLKNGADSNRVDQKGNSLLFKSVNRKDDPKYVKLLLKYGADRDMPSSDGRTPRTLAGTYRDKTIFKLFR